MLDHTPEALLRLPTVCQITGLGSSAIYRMMAEGAFPRPRQIGERSVGWLQSEVVAWIRKLPEAPPKRLACHAEKGHEKGHRSKSADAA